MHTKNFYDLALAIDCEHDWDFVRLIEAEARKVSLSTYLIWPDNFDETFQDLKSEKVGFLYLYDRASDTSSNFKSIYDLILDTGGGIFEAWEKIQWASDKATMHLEFISKGILTPYTIILPSFGSKHEIFLTLEDLSNLGRPFIIKPANTTGGGIGVVEGAETLQEILKARQEFSKDKYLLQEKIAPFEKDGKRFWFRCFYTCGLVQCAWWSDLTHKYEKLYEEDILRYNLDSLFSITKKIAAICHLNFFSTEIALTTNRRCVVIDYVNEICDMRLQSQHYDGVLDEMVRKIAVQIVSHVRQQLKKKNHNGKIK